MAVTRLQLRTRLRYAAKDSESPYTIDAGDAGGLFNGWIESGIAQINRAVPHIAAVGTFAGNGSSTTPYILSSALGATFHRLQLLSILATGGRVMKKHPQGMKYIRRMQIAGTVITGVYPRYYAMSDWQTLYFDKKLVTSQTVTADFWARTTAMANDSSSPQGLLAEGWDDLILAAAKMHAGNDIGGEIGRVMLNDGLTLFKDRIKEFDEYVRAQGFLDESDGIAYADMGDSTIEDYNDDAIYSDPWPV